MTHDELIIKVADLALDAHMADEPILGNALQMIVLGFQVAAHLTATVGQYRKRLT